MAGLKSQLKEEKTGKRKLYSSLVKLANELKRTRHESQPLRDAMEYANQSWYEGGMWRAPTILPGVTSQQVRTVLREATGLSDLFFNLVIVTAFTRVGISVAENGSLSLDTFLYFAVFWMFWTKDIMYSTRFDSTDLSFEIVNVLSCIAVLFGSLSTNAPLQSEGGTRIMMMAGFVAVLHLLLHVRVAFYYRSAEPASIEEKAKRHAIFSILMTVCETLTWAAGVLLPEFLSRRWIIFVVGIGFSIARQKNFMENDFHAASSKRGVLFILLLGFLLQSVIVVASPFFEYQSPSMENYAFIGACCLMLYCIKLLYSDDAPKLAQDHALLVNDASALFFNIGQFSLLLSTTVLGSGLDLLTHSYLAATAALPHNAKEMVCGGFGMVVFSIFFIKSMHLKRIPADGTHKVLFVGAFMTQIIVNLAVVTLTISLYLGKPYFDVLAQDEITLMLGLAGVTLFLVILSWLDEAMELALYTSGDDSRQALVHPFGLWWCVAPELESMEEEESDGSGALSALSPLLGKSVANLKMPSNDGYDSISSSKFDV
mmetsp:Transcript_7414/g.12332  ORF Transcript_7414/g.12332 Transcript_7414/m.12332 type:complete len:543 (+) Transcript_7414:450-2078(+)